jgi:(p)ppGpp synthase/HD superfamily hydrolase
VRRLTHPVATVRERGAKMEERVRRTAIEVGVDAGGLRLVCGCHRAVMHIRDRDVADDHDPRYLHPSRSALILMQDVREADPVVLAGTLLSESEDRELLVAAGDLARAVQAQAVGRVLQVRDAVPQAGGEDVAERLVIATPEVRRAALAERLDHLRHAHLWSDVARRRRAHAEAESVYLPVAQRTHPELARRLGWWCRMFARRHLD